MDRGYILRRISSGYLWFLPLSFPVFAGIYRLWGLAALLVGGVLYFGAIAIAVWQVLKIPDSKRSTPSVVAGVTLITGGAVTWLSGGVGPPDFSHPVALYFNSAGLLTGWIVVLGGFVVLTAATWDVADRALSLLGLIGFTLATAFFTAQRMVLWALAALLQGDSTGARASSDVVMAMMFARVSLAMAAVVAGYLAVAAFGGAMWKCGRLGNVWGTIVVGVTVLLVATDVVWPITLAVPPAFVCLFPYFIGVILLRESRVSHAKTTLGDTESNKDLQPSAALGS
jgi:hypothetical protein